MTAITDSSSPPSTTGPDAEGPRFHDAMRELREQSWLASMPLGFVALEREAGEFFLRSRVVHVPRA